MAFALGAVHVARAERRRPAPGDAAGASSSSGDCRASTTPRGCFARPRRARRRAARRRGRQSLTDRNEALGSARPLVRRRRPDRGRCSPRCVGYALATVGLRPVEAMRRRAARVSLGGEPERLPLARRARRDPPARRDAQRDARPAASARSSASAASWPTRATSCARRSRSSRPSWRARCAAVGYEPRACARRCVAAVEECDHLAQLAEDLLVLARAADGRLPVRPEPLDVARAARGRRGTASSTARAERGPRRSASTRRRTLVVMRRRAAAAPGARRTWSTTRSATATARSTLRARGPRRTASRSTSPTRATASAPDLAARAFERFTRGERVAHRRAARGSASRSCGRSRRARRRRGRSSRGPGGTTVRLTLPAGPPQPAAAPAPADANTATPSQVPLI